MNENDEKKIHFWEKELTRRELLKAGAIGGLAAVAASCAPAPAAPTPTPVPKKIPTPTVVKKKTTLTMGIGGELPGLNVLVKVEAPGHSMYYACWDSWMKGEFTADGTLKRMKPLLMTEWKVSEDKHTWQFKLREGVKFHNGEDFDAEAAAFSVDYVMTSELSSITARSLLRALYDGVEVVDKYTLNVKTKQPFVMTPLVFVQLWTVPPRYYQDVGPEGFAEKPVGIGQYRFVEWRKGQHIILEKNPDYWGEQATIDELIFKPFPEDATRVAALQAGELDMAYNVPPDDAQRLTDAGFEISWIPLGQAMNLTMKTGSNPKHPYVGPINDKRVRQAMNYAVDNDSLVKDIMGGYARPLDGQIVGPSCFGYNPDLKRYPYDPDKAKALLAEAGYPDGFTMDFDTSQGRYSKQKEVSEWMVGEYAKVGINLNMHLYEWSAFRDKVYTDQSAPVFYTGRNWYPIMDDEQCIKMYACAERRAQMCEPELEEMLAAERAAFDREERKKILHKMHAWLRDHAPVVYLFEAPDIFGHTKRVKNFTPTPDNHVHLRGVYVEEA